MFQKLFALATLFLLQTSFMFIPTKNSHTSQPCIAPPLMSVNYIMGKFDPATHPDFIAVEKKHADKEGLFLRKETYEAYKKMRWAAQQDSVLLTIVSATRNFEYQKGIWDAKWKSLTTLKDATARAKKIMEYSAMPSCSRHHWGTDIDLTTVSSAFFDKPEGKKMYDWLTKNAARFGFCQPYTAGRKTGYKEEKWHWTYLTLSKDLTSFAEKNLKNDMITGFSGAETAASLDVVKNYVLGINKGCL
ncbi:MAG: M15 family metallopeptidase [Saprospiraceae bacterium]|nr:M15 family metallopeptidase [Saprospiraceae bacterium]